jgi:hypothetical protein
MGEYDAMPPGTNTFLMYYKGTRWSESYNNGSKVADDTRLVSNIGVLRYSRFGKIGKYLVSMPQFILPFGELEGRSNLSHLGNDQGVGDLLVPLPVFLVNNALKRRTFVINPVIHVPIGSYDNDQPLNLGGNRWIFELQVGGSTAIAEKWNLDVVTGVEFFQDNTDFSPDSLTL